MKKTAFIYCGILLILASCSEAYFGGGGNENPDPSDCPCASVNGEIIGLSSDISGKEISLTRKGNEFISYKTFINVDGTYVFEKVPQGSYEIEVDGLKMDYEIYNDRVISIDLKNRLSKLQLVE